MKIFSASQIRKWDDFTIKNEPITSIDLMERAAQACTNWLFKKFDHTKSFKIFCGTGNNGGDGLAIARLLIERKYNVAVYIAGTGLKGSPDFIKNLTALQATTSEIYFLDTKESFPLINKGDVVIDALFGTGLNKKPKGIFSKLINFINKADAIVVSIDIPSGMYADSNSISNLIIKASYSLTFQQLKLSFLMAENESYTGKIIVMDIALSEDFIQGEDSNYRLVDKALIKKIYTPRNNFSNKGNYGYACLVAGSFGMMGAAVLSAKACLRSGVGKLTCYICKEGYVIMQTSVPEAMCKVFGKTFIKEIENVKDFDVTGIGPGIGKHLSHKKLLQTVFKNSAKPIVIDADALNVLSAYQSLYKSIPRHSIITPHPKEFERLFGTSRNDFERMEVALKKASELDIYIILKGHHTLIATPEGQAYFNSTGNSGMATAGSGDVLTGIITGLLAQHYSPLDACILGVYLHGLAGDIAATHLSKESLIAEDIIDNLGNAFTQVSQFNDD